MQPVWEEGVSLQVTDLHQKLRILLHRRLSLPLNHSFTVIYYGFPCRLRNMRFILWVITHHAFIYFVPQIALASPLGN